MAKVQPLRREAQRKFIRSINPSTGEELFSFLEMDRSEVGKRIALSAEAFQDYRKTSFSERSGSINRVASILEDEREKWAELISIEMGKLKQAAVDEVLKCARTCRFYAENAEKFLADRPAKTEAARSFVAFQPLGPVLAIMPWNFPFWQVLRFAAPALMAGNTVLLKHASNVPQCALALEEIFRSAGFPEGAFTTLLISSREVEPVLADPRVRAVTLTGSDTAGARVASAAGAHLKKVVLELGGSDPFIVMPSADLAQTIQRAVAARTINNGESCVASKRFILHESIAEGFEKKFVEAMRSLRVGDPLEPSTQIGPLATEEIIDRLSGQVEDSARDGARVLTGGRKIGQAGFFYEPTVISSIPKASRAYREEFFGPVALLFRAKDLDEAIAIANDSPFGLGSSLWSEDPAEHERFIREIEAGMAFVNAQVASDPRVPFGGIKRSGYGRELADFGIREFVNIKTVWIQKGSQTPKGSCTE